MKDEIILFASMRKNQRKSLITIAKRLRSGEASQEFLNYLALVIDPRIERNCFNLKLRPTFLKKALPDPFLNAHIGERYEQLIEEEASKGRSRGMSKRIVYALSEEFGVKRATVYAGLKALRDHRLLLEEFEELKRAYPDQV